MRKNKAKRESINHDTVKYAVGMALAAIAWWIIHISQAIGRSQVQIQGAKHLIYIELLMLVPTVGFLANRRAKRSRAARDKLKAERS